MTESRVERMIVGRKPDIRVGAEVQVDYPGMHDLHGKRFTVLSVDQVLTLGPCATLDTQRRYPQKWAFDVTLPFKYLVPVPPADEQP